MDPLVCLRDFYKSGRGDKVVFTDGTSKIKFGDEYEFYSSTATRFNKSGSVDPYQLGALLFCMQHKDLSSKDYFEKASAAKIDKVLRVDQQVLIH
jgi:hypothetical protein